MIFKLKQRSISFKAHFMLFLLFFTVLFAHNGYAVTKGTEKKILLGNFNYILSSTMKNIEQQFPQELTKILRSNDYLVQPINSTPTSAKSAQTETKTHKADALLYGDVSQVGSNFVINAFYVNSQGNQRAISLDFPANTKLEAIAVSMVQQIKQINITNSKGIVNVPKGAIAEVIVEGTHLVDKEIVLSRMLLTVGDFPNAEKLNEDIHRIWGSGYFNDVQANVVERAGKKVLMIKVKERPHIGEIALNGSEALDVDDITDVITTQVGSVLNDSILVEDIQKIKELYRKEGYYNIQVDYEVIEKQNAPAVLTFNVVEGQELYITNIVFNGIEELDTDELRKFLVLKERGFLSFLTGSGILKEEDLSRDAQTIVAFAVNNGYINAQVATPEVTYNEDGITITYTINEGKRFHLGDISFQGVLIDAPARFYKEIALDEWKEENKYFSLEVLQDDIKKLTTFYQNEGYAFTKVNVQDGVDEENSTINITYLIEPGEKVYVSRINIAGNYKTRDNIILRELRLADGDLFSGTKIERTQDRLLRTGHFKNVNIEPVPTNDPALVDLLVNVEEENTGSISAGFGYSSYDGMGVSAGISQNNLFGRGYQIGINGYISEKELNATTYFWNPRIYDTNLGAGISLYGVDEDWIDYDKETIGGQLNFSYPIGEFTSLEWGYRLDQYNIYNVTKDAAPSIANYKGKNIASVALLGIVRDSTNGTFFITKGTKVSLNLEYGGNFLGGDDNFVKAIFAAGGYYTPFENHTLHFRGTIGGVFENSSKIVPSFERFYIGGMNSIRGYTYEDISPRDPRNNESIGADRVSYGSLEYIWTVSPELGIAAVPFYDIATATDSAVEEMFSRVYQSVGLEFRWRSPMGDLRFAYGYPLSKDVTGKKKNSGRFEFSMGRAF